MFTRLKEIRKKIASVDIPERWKVEGSESPNAWARHMADVFVVFVYAYTKLLPDSVGADIEGGILMCYKIRDMSIMADFFNDESCCILVNDDKNKRIIDAWDINPSLSAYYDCIDYINKAYNSE